jgi:NAD(P)-dependent dehydrogenase (short-subunit alcohol dehydrogenase family)
MEGKVAIVTGGGRGIGREECLLLAREGAKVVVADFGGELDGAGFDERPAAEVARMIREQGGQAVACNEDVRSFSAAERIVKCALDAFGRLDALINNAGILRDRMIFNLSEEELDAVLAVHVKGHVGCARFASAYWRDESKAGREAPRHIVNTTSGAGLIGNVGQTGYAAAKAGIAVLTRVWASELERFGVRVNALAPIARTRITTATFGDLPPDADAFDEMHPGNVAPLAVYLASDLSNPVSGEIFGIRGGTLDRYVPWNNPKTLEKEGRWEVAEIAGRIQELLS